MKKVPIHQDSELLTMSEATALLSDLPSDEARLRVLSYLFARFFPNGVNADDSPFKFQQPPPNKTEEQPNNDLKGIAELANGGIAIVTHAFWARNRLDTAIRLAKLAIYSCHVLTGKPLSSRYSLTPLLQEWELYDGNTRARLAREKTILREGDDLTLSPQGMQDASQLVDEIRSPNGNNPKHGILYVKPGADPGSSTQQGYIQIESWGDYANNSAIGMHVVDKDGIIQWANTKELKFLGYRADEYIGGFIGNFHLDPMVVEDILGKLSRFETITNYPAQMRAKDGSIRYVMINSNAYQQLNGEFGHSRCFTTAINEKIWAALTA